MILKKQFGQFRSIVTDNWHRLLFVIALLMVAVVALAFRLYTSSSVKPVRTALRPVEWSRATPLPDHIILTYATNPATTQSVTWRTDTTIKKAFAEIALADAAPRFWKEAVTVPAITIMMDAMQAEDAQTASHHHSVTFNGLLPDTLYAYRVGDGSQWSEWFHFRTASKEAKPFQFLFMGDAQNNILESYSRIVREAYKKAPDARFTIHAGDLVEGAHNERQWHEWFTAAGWINGSMSTLPAPGNHEYGGFTRAQHKADNRPFSLQWKNQFTLPQNGPEGLKEMAYYVDYQGVRFVVLNSSEKIKEQAVWLEGLLKSNSPKWTVVTFHHPVFSAAHHKDNKELRTLWQPLFEKYGVDLVLTGHEHTYTRGQAIKQGKTAGPVYVVSVSGGKMYGFEGESWKGYAAQLQRKGENTQLFQVVSIDGDRLQFDTYMATGTLYDTFELVKDAQTGRSVLQQQDVRLAVERSHRNTIAY